MSMRAKIAAILVALYEENDGPLDGLTEADAVFDALMEPSGAMLNAASAPDGFEPYDVFRTMIQAARDGK